MFGPSTFQAIASLFSVYVPLSMISSALTEWLGTLTGSRSRILLAGLARLLGDPSHKYKVNVSSDSTKLEKVKTADGKTETKQTDVQTTVQKPLALAILEHPLVQGSASPNLFAFLPFGLGKRFSQPSYCDPKLLVNALIDVISPAPAASAVRSPSDILLAIDQMPAGEPKRLMQSLANSPLAQGENGSFEKALEHWIENGMERISGWYKRRAQKVIMIFSAILASGLNIDTLALLKTLDIADPTQMTKPQGELPLTKADTSKDAATEATKAETTNATAEPAKADPSSHVTTEPPKNAPAEPAKTATPKNSTTEPAKAATPKNSTTEPAKPETPKNATVEPAKSETSKSEASELTKTSAGTHATPEPTIAGKDKARAPGSGLAMPGSLDAWGPEYLLKIWNGQFDLSELIKKIVGLIFSVIAITMGAPFYFDMLKKVSNVRLTGVPPDELK